MQFEHANLKATLRTDAVTRNLFPVQRIVMPASGFFLLVRKRARLGIRGNTVDEYWEKQIGLVAPDAPRYGVSPLSPNFGMIGSN